MIREGKQLLLGNEAIVRGLFEAGVDFASTYPGTPSSEIGNLLEKLASDAGMYFEFSTNEKVAMEVSAAAASSGLRSFVFMKHVGLNVAADPMMTLAYSGVTGGMLILTADDPSAHSSQNEQDNRYYSQLGLLPMVEPSTPAEAKDMVKAAYAISSETTLPVLFRTTTRVNHARGVVDLGELGAPKGKGHFDKDVVRFVNIPAHARVNRKRLLELMKRAAELSESSPLNFVEGEGDIGVITSGVSYTYVKEFVKGVSILKLGFTNPLPERRIAEFVKGKRYVVVVEELEPFLEDQVLRICAQNSLDVPVYGKRSGHLPYAWEFNPKTLEGVDELVDLQRFRESMPATQVKLPSYCSDIGCYTLGVAPPFQTADFIICMGGGAGAAGGFAAATDQTPIAFIGDSTFFHAGVPALVNALFNDHKIIMVILDNRTTAMTGHQPNPGTGREFGGIQTEPIDIEKLVRGIGVKYVEEVDPYDVKAATKAMKGALEHDGVAVIISKCPCPLELKKRKMLEVKRCEVDQSKCIRCYTCLKMIACPSLIKRGDAVEVDPTQCIGCGMCANVCPKNAIEVKR